MDVEPTKDTNKKTETVLTNVLELLKMKKKLKIAL